MRLFTNVMRRSLNTMFPGQFLGAKHNHYADFGYPDVVTQDLLRHMYRRNSLAKAVVKKTVDKVWQDTPRFVESTATHAETKLEADIRQHLATIRGWQMLKDSNARSLVSGWSATILLFEDGKALSEPVDTMPGANIEFLAGMLPVWRDQLKANAWVEDENSPHYGAPTMYTFTEKSQWADAGVDTASNKPSRVVNVHPDRVLIWSPDGMPYGTSVLEACYNDLLDIEKISGAGGEAFWKNSKGGSVLKLAEGTEIQQLLKDMGATDQTNLIDKMNQQLDDFAKGLDKALILQNMELENPTVDLPSPEHFRRGPLENLSAATGIPVKVLVGSQTGERASTEDAREWAQTCMSRRHDLTHPTLTALVERLESFGLLPEHDWHVYQPDLTEATQAQKVVNSSAMADIDQKSGTTVFTTDEKREAAGYGPLTEEQKAAIKKEQEEADARLEKQAKAQQPDDQPRTTKSQQPDQEGERIN